MQFDIQGDIAFLQRAGVLKLLLKDRTTGRHILWGTDAYGLRGPEYARDQEIEIGQIVGENLGLLKTRAQKAAEQQTERTRQHAEVFTPAWICRMMNDQADSEWFGREEVFFRKDGTPTERVDFKRKSWKRYVDSKRLEITCGEAPYLVSRYDVSSGEPIPLSRRVGLLDRKLRVVNENTDTETDWLKWTFRAFEATYGYEFQGDNLLIARVNLMMTFREALESRWQRQPTREEWRRLSRIVTWNIWQMDGLTYTLPYAKGHDLLEQTDFFSQLGFERPEDDDKQPYSRIFLWRNTKSSTEFRKIKEGADGMKFDFIIGNPPYQEERPGESNTALPIYHQFMASSYEVGEAVELITPARFLFNAGRTPKQWNEKMLNDTHLKVLFYRKDASEIFPNTEIKGGVVVTYHDNNREYTPIGTFTIFSELNSILGKVLPSVQHIAFSSKCFVATKFDIQNLVADYPQYDGHERRMSSNVLSFECFHDKPVNDNDIMIYGIYGRSRKGRYISQQYVDTTDTNIKKYKIVLPKADGNGAFGDTITMPEILSDNTGFTHTFLGLGGFDSKEEAEAAMKYIKCKFVRALLGVLKVTQDLNADKWKYVPLQDFTPSSDVDWSVSIPEIDRQLYAKYGLDESEIAFIESHVKEMV